MRSGRLSSGLVLAVLAGLGAEPPAAPSLPPEPPSAPARAPQALTPAPQAGDRPLPINLATSLQLAQARPIDVALASSRVELALAELKRARVLWLPSIQVGVDYFRHDGQIQDIVGNVFGTSRSALLLGAAPNLVFATTDALFAPLAQRQVVRAREAQFEATRNDTTLAVAEAFFGVQQARGDLVGALTAAGKAEELLQRTEKLAENGGLVPPFEVSRVRADLARRRQQVHLARQRWRTASADLARLLRLDAAALVDPLEPPEMRVCLVGAEVSVDDLIPVALTNRPELAAQQALVQATIARLRQEKLRPLMPSILLRGASTNPAGTLAGGYFGGGRNDRIGDFSARSDFDVQVLWEWQNLGFGNKALVDARKAENKQAILELFRVQDRVAAEVAQAHAELRGAIDRLAEAEVGLAESRDTVEKSFDGLRQTKTAGRVILLVVRPQEAVAAVQALGQAYNDYFAAVADHNRAQFRLYRALGQPAQALAQNCPHVMPANSPGEGRPPSPALPQESPTR